MAFNGSGTFVRVYSWAQDLINNIYVTASRMDTEMDGMATGLSTCITKDGQTTITASLPMAGFRHTGVGNANARTDYGVVGQIVNGSYHLCTVGGTADAITLTPSPAITSYATGQTFVFTATSTNTGATTVAVSGLATKAITKRGTTALEAGDIFSTAIIVIRYDGTQFQITDDVQGRPINMQDNLLTRPTIKDYAETKQAVTITAAAATFDLTLGNVIALTHDADLTTLTISNPSPTGSACSFTLIRIKDNSATTRLITWPAAVKWPGNIDPVLTQSANAVDIMVFITYDAGTTWYANLAGNNYS